MATGIRINAARNFAGQLYATQDWVNSSLGAFLNGVGALNENIVTFTKGNGSSVQLDLSALVKGDSKAIVVTNNAVSLKIAEDEKYLVADQKGLATTGIDKAITDAVDAGKTALVDNEIKAIWDYVGRDDTVGLSKRIADAEKAITDLTTNAINVSGEDAIVVTDGTGAEKVISLKLDGTDKILSQGADGLKTTIGLAVRTTGIGENVSKQYYLAGIDGEQIGDTVIDIAKDQFLKDATYDADTHKLTFEFNVADGTAITEIDLSGLVDVYTASKGVTQVGSDFQGVVDPNTEKVVTGKDGDGNQTTAAVLTVGENGFRTDNVQTAINYAVTTAVTPVKTAVETAVQLVGTTVTIPAETKGTWTSAPIEGRVMHVSDKNGVVYPDIVYSTNDMNCTTVLSADFGDVAITEDETWNIIVAKPIVVA